MTTPMLRLELEGMRYHVIHALVAHQDEIQKQVDATLKDTLESFDVKTVVRESVERELAKAIKDAVAHAASAICWDKDIRDLLQAGAARKVREAIESALKVKE